MRKVPQLREKAVFRKQVTSVWMNPPGAMGHDKGEPAPEFQIEFAHRLDHLGPETDPDTLVRLLPYCKLN